MACLIDDSIVRGDYVTNYYSHELRQTLCDADFDNDDYVSKMQLIFKAYIQLAKNTALIIITTVQSSSLISKH